MPVHIGRAVRQCPKCGLYNVWTPCTRKSTSKKLGFSYRHRRHVCHDCGYSFATYEVNEKEYKMIRKSLMDAKAIRDGDTSYLKNRAIYFIEELAKLKKKEIHDTCNVQTASQDKSE